MKKDIYESILRGYKILFESDPGWDLISSIPSLFSDTVDVLTNWGDKKSKDEDVRDIEEKEDKKEENVEETKEENDDIEEDFQDEIYDIYAEFRNDPYSLNIDNIASEIEELKEKRAETKSELSQSTENEKEPLKEKLKKINEILYRKADTLKVVPTQDNIKNYLSKEQYDKKVKNDKELLDYEVQLVIDNYSASPEKIREYTFDNIRATQIARDLLENKTASSSAQAMKKAKNMLEYTKTNPISIINIIIGDNDVHKQNLKAARIKEVQDILHKKYPNLDVNSDEFSEKTYRILDKIKKSWNS